MGSPAPARSGLFGGGTGAGKSRWRRVVALENVSRRQPELACGRTGGGVFEGSCQVEREYWSSEILASFVGADFVSIFASGNTSNGLENCLYLINLTVPFAYNAALIPVAAGVLWPMLGILLSPVFAAGAMALSSVFVLGNALRLRRFQAPMVDAARAAA